MARRTSQTLRHWAWGLTLTLGGATVVAQSTLAAPPQAPANLEESAVSPPLRVRPSQPPVESDEPTPAAPREAQSSGSEVIRERYPNRAVKIERHVAQDDEGN